MVGVSVGRICALIVRRRAAAPGNNVGAGAAIVWSETRHLAGLAAVCVRSTGGALINAQITGLALSLAQ